MTAVMLGANRVRELVLSEDSNDLSRNQLWNVFLPQNLEAFIATLPN